MGIFGEILRSSQPKLVEQHIDSKLEELDSRYFSVPEGFFRDKTVEDAFLWFSGQVKSIFHDFENALHQASPALLPFTLRDRLFIDAQKQKIEAILVQSILESLDIFVSFCRLKFQSLGFEFEAYRQSILEIIYGKQSIESNKNLPPSVVKMFHERGYSLCFSDDFRLLKKEKDSLHQYLTQQLTFERYLGVIWSVCKFDTKSGGRGCRIIALGKYVIGCFTHVEYDDIFTNSKLKKGEEFPSGLRERFAHLL